MSSIKRFAAITVLSAVYLKAGIYARLTRWVWRRPRKTSGRVMLIGTFHNPNWFHAHVIPIVQANEGGVILVCDEPVEEVDGLETICPPPLANKLLSRALAKFLWGLAAAIRQRPDVVMGYHIFPAAISALIIGRSVNALTGYQMTAGPLETEGGGWNAENVVLRMLGHASPFVERRVLGAIRHFDEVIVRGTRAQTYLRDHGFAGTIRIITGSVEVPETVADYASREYDLVFVGRLTEYKRPDRLLKVIEGLVKNGLTDLRVLMIGEGPDREELEASAAAAGITENIEWAGQRSDVVDQLQRARMFILTSRWEGLSIALLEAMIGGLVPVVSNVGDLSDVVHNGENGFIPDEDDIESFIDAVGRVARDPSTWEQLSAAARSTGIAKASRATVIGQWREMFADARRGDPAE